MKRIMKKIKRLEDIEREKMRLRVQQLEQEQAIRKEWQELKEALSPGTLLRNKLTELSADQHKAAPIISGLLQVGTMLLGKKISVLATESLESALQKGWKLLKRKSS
jgi:hypothetical protein